MLMSKCEPVLSYDNKLSIIAQGGVSNPVLMLSITKFYTDVAQIVLFFQFVGTKEKWKLGERNCIEIKRMLPCCILSRLALQSKSNYCYEDCAKQSTIDYLIGVNKL